MFIPVNQMVKTEFAHVAPDGRILTLFDNRELAVKRCPRGIKLIKMVTRYEDITPVDKVGEKELAA